MLNEVLEILILILDSAIYLCAELRLGHCLQGPSSVLMKGCSAFAAIISMTLEKCGLDTLSDFRSHPSTHPSTHSHSAREPLLMILPVHFTMNSMIFIFVGTGANIGGLSAEGYTGLFSA